MPARYQLPYFKVLFWSLVSTLLVSLLFIFFPTLDVDFSRLFWSEQEKFFFDHTILITFLSRYNYFLVICYLSLCVVAVVIFWRWRRGLSYVEVLYLFTSLVLGAGLLVNSLLKSYWGRARPLATEDFGGEKPFTSAWYIAANCDANCSFVSGHASAMFAFYALALVVAVRKKHLILTFTLVTFLGLIVGFGRIVEGKHYLSDILVAGHLIWLVALICYYPLWHSQRRALG